MSYQCHGFIVATKAQLEVRAGTDMAWLLLVREAFGASGSIAVVGLVLLLSIFDDAVGLGRADLVQLGRALITFAWYVCFLHFSPQLIEASWSVGSLRLWWRRTCSQDAVLDKRELGIQRNEWLEKGKKHVPFRRAIANVALLVVTYLLSGAGCPWVAKNKPGNSPKGMKPSPLFCRRYSGRGSSLDRRIPHGAD